MKISDITCPSCGSSYEVAESSSAHGNPGRIQCAVCADLLDSWQEPKVKVHRLVLSSAAHKDLRAPAPPSPQLSPYA
jgi:predicted Zn finger-like uncharacterized protein